MYRNYMNRSCNCGCNNVDIKSEDYVEDSCSNVQNTLDLYGNECDCGYDEFNVFPENPVFRAKLCANSKNE